MGRNSAREVSARGYTGSRLTVTRFLLGLGQMKQQGMEVTQAATTTPLTPRRTVGLMLRSPEKLTAEETSALRQVCQLQTLFEQLAHILRDRRGEELDHWLYAAFHSGIPEFHLLLYCQVDHLTHLTHLTHRRQ